MGWVGRLADDGRRSKPELVVSSYPYVFVGSDLTIVQETKHTLKSDMSARKETDVFLTMIFQRVAEMKLV